MVQYYTLQEAAAKLQLSPDQLKEMAKKNQLRAFQDRGTLRFRAQEIDELARSRGANSEAELRLGDLPAASEPKSGPKSMGPRSTRTSKLNKPADKPEAVTDHEEVSLGHDPASAASGSKNTPRNTQTRSPNPRRSSVLKSPRPAVGSDSDVRLVGDSGGLDFQLDSDVKAEKSPPPGPKSPGAGRKSRVDAGPESGVRIVPLDEGHDSDVKIVPDDNDSQVPLGQSKSKTPSDSDIRLEELESHKGRKDERNNVTEEIDLDAEELKAARDAADRHATRPKPRDVSSTAPLPTNSPFELSDPDMELTPKSGLKRGSRLKPEEKPLDDDKDSSSDFELTPLQNLASSPLDLGSDEHTPIRFEDSDEEEVGLGELTGPGAGTSGINLRDPVDSGISLEQGGSDEIELELNLDADLTPSPSKKVDSSSEFELSLDDSDELAPDAGSSSEFELSLDEDSAQSEDGSSSEFELSLDLDDAPSEELKSEGGSDSEFELTIDDSGGLDALEDSASLEEEDKDIFETDFEVPALEDESGSEALALDEAEADGDADFQSSEFDLEVDEDADTEAESGSEVVALDEDEEVDEVVPVKKRRGARTAVADEDEEVEPADLDEFEEAEEAGELVGAPVSKEWGVVPVLFMTPCALVMIFVCLMSYEMIAKMWGYHQSTPVSSLVLDPVARMFDDTLPSN